MKGRNEADRHPETWIAIVTNEIGKTIKAP